MNIAVLYYTSYDYDTPDIFLAPFATTSWLVVYR